MKIQPRDANGRFMSLPTWRLAYALEGLPVPARVGKRNRIAPLTVAEVERRARKRPVVRTHKVVPIKRTPTKKGKKVVGQQAPAKKAPPLERAAPAGSEFELTFRYKARGASAKRALHFKMRVVLTTAMTNDQAEALTRQAVQRGIVPGGIAIDWIDWSRGNSSEENGGVLNSPDHDDLRVFRGLFQASADSIRFAKVAASMVDL